MKKYYTYKNEENLQMDDVKENPLDLLDEVNMFKKGTADEEDFYEVEKENKKFKLGAKISVKGLFNAGIEYIKETTKKSVKDSNLISSSGNYARIGSSGNYARIGSSGNYARIGSSGDSTQICSSGDSTQICSSGDSTQICSSGDSTQICSSGDSTQICSSGDSTQICSSGNYARINLKGSNSVALCAGDYSIIKGKKGSWITLSEWDVIDDKLMLIMVKSAQIGNSEYTDYKGKTLKEDTYYSLINKEFVPITLIDGYRMVILSNIKEIDGYKVFKSQYDLDFKDKKSAYQYIAEKDGYTAHGKTIRQAIEDVEFKRLKNANIEEHISRIKEHGYMTAKDYRLITGACQYGTNKWLKENNLTWEDKKSVEEVLEMVKGEYGYDRFKQFAEKYNMKEGMKK